MTLGHPIVDLWVLAVLQLTSLRRGLGERGEDTPESLAAAFLDLLSDQREQEGMNSWRELEAIGQNLDLIAESGPSRTAFRGEAEQRSGLIPNRIPGSSRTVFRAEAEQFFADPGMLFGFVPE